LTIHKKYFIKLKTASNKLLALKSKTEPDFDKFFQKLKNAWEKAKFIEKQLVEEAA
jgi:hypothetical protein